MDNKHINMLINRHNIDFLSCTNW